MKNFFRLWRLLLYAYLIFNMAISFGYVTDNKSCILSFSISVTSESINIRLMPTEIHFDDLDINGLWIVAADGSKTYFIVSKFWMTKRKLIEILKGEIVYHFNNWGIKLIISTRTINCSPTETSSHLPDGWKWVWPFQVKNSLPIVRDFLVVLGWQDMLSEVTHCREGQCLKLSQSPWGEPGARCVNLCECQVWRDRAGR